nr:immunoglobulin heavy chain junction region [Mus musculus]NSM06639.1 immunoglobulin heavy chain junction region [Mus musculus]NSM06719.1 immunoglobulin heavy chain junction region [Mus musculus]NSM07305.1 immunoglobulin heavy chain junction region [Mus musculus]NSM09615.1 immunoglobulin heavy chain junction region [Mus musculus]
CARRGYDDYDGWDFDYW